MREFLVKFDGGYKLVVCDKNHEGIEVPDGAIAYIRQKNVWSGFINTMDHVGVGEVLWQREKVEVEVDSVNQPSHYISHPSGIECIEITRHHDFAIGNAIKYLWRAGLKDSDNEIQDLEKAAWYIQDKIKQLKGE